MPRAFDRPFALIRGVPADLVRAVDRADPLPPAWQVPVRIVIHDSGTGHLTPFAQAADLGAALQRIAIVFDRPGCGDPEAYPLASPDVLALVAELRSPALRELCLTIDNTMTARWPGELRGSVYLRDVRRAFPGERYLIGWEATGPMVDLAWAFLVRA